MTTAPPTTPVRTFDERDPDMRSLVERHSGSDPASRRPNRYTRSIARSIQPLSSLPRAPVFVLGVHRSGTTWLSQSLARRGRCSPFAVRHLLSAVDRQRHTEQSATDRLIAAGVRTRPGDGLPVRASSSEEYGYLLALHTGSSRTTGRSVSLLRDAIAQLQVEQPDHAPVLRNPWDYAATHKLARWFPDARFVFVHRDPIATVGSAVEMFQSFWTEPHPYGVLMSPRYRRAWARAWQRHLFQGAARRPHWVGRLVAGGTVLAHRAHLTDAASLDSARTIHVRYAELLRDPIQRVDELLHQLDIPADGAAPVAARTRPSTDRAWMQPICARLIRRTERYRLARALDPTTE